MYGDAAKCAFFRLEIPNTRDVSDIFTKVGQCVRLICILDECDHVLLLLTNQNMAATEINVKRFFF